MMIFVLYLVGISGVAGAVHAALFGPRARARKRLRDASRELVDGAVVTLTGKVVAKTKLVEAPLSGREGVAYFASARVYTIRPAPKVAVELVESMMVDFELHTKGGIVSVEGDTVQVELRGEPLIPRKLAREQRFLDVHGYQSENAAAAGFDEVVITAGMKISVHGVVQIEAAPDESTYRETGKKIVLAGHPAHPLTIGRPL